MPALHPVSHRGGNLVGSARSGSLALDPGGTGAGHTPIDDSRPGPRYAIRSAVVLLCAGCSLGSLDRLLPAGRMEQVLADHCRRDCLHGNHLCAGRSRVPRFEAYLTGACMLDHPAGRNRRLLSAHHRLDAMGAKAALAQPLAVMDHRAETLPFRATHCTPMSWAASLPR